MMEWQDIDSAPRDGTPFLALNSDFEVWVAKYEQRHGRLCFRQNHWRDSYKYIVREIDGCEWRHYSQDFGRDNSGWTNHWSLWTKGYEFQPTHWLPLPHPPKEQPHD